MRRIAGHEYPIRIGLPQRLMIPLLVLVRAVIGTTRRGCFPRALSDEAIRILSVAFPAPVPKELIGRLVQLRRQHPSRGPRKLLARLEAFDPSTRWPAVSTVGEILQRHGLVQPRRRHARAHR
jgi:hypothetical protein